MSQIRGQNKSCSLCSQHCFVLHSPDDGASPAFRRNQNRLTTVIFLLLTVPRYHKWGKPPKSAWSSRSIALYPTFKMLVPLMVFWPRLDFTCDQCDFYVRELCWSTYRYRLDVRLSVCPSVTRWYCIKTAERIFMISLPHNSPFILVLCIPKS